jgi:hypothetical protein
MGNEGRGARGEGEHCGPSLRACRTSVRPSLVLSCAVTSNRLSRSPPSHVCAPQNVKTICGCRSLPSVSGCQAHESALMEPTWFAILFMDMRAVGISTTPAEGGPTATPAASEGITSEDNTTTRAAIAGAFML